jgi:hypothetical protein
LLSFSPESRIEFDWVDLNCGVVFFGVKWIKQISHIIVLGVVIEAVVHFNVTAFKLEAKTKATFGSFEWAREVLCVLLVWR